ncbi:hypothetical protein [Microvirga puerhi]|uniref:Uncharacterized protein n=1 Tax=Microvirga puerhi TaxID=2876078 RepID=A0ABS7VUS8_9HYPH|nr:hypothetical protein [Microvirga puerhi]MBZ6078657.1 hypothetical protein [Microvirga puerhi]
MSDRVEYWWVDCDAGIQPAEVTFRSEIPIHIRLIGSRDIIAAASVELMERLPAAPRLTIQRTPPPSAPEPPRQSVSLLWLVGIILLILVYWFSGPLFDVLK